MATYFRSEVSFVGDGVAEMVDGGVTIFFAEPCPQELAEVSIVHKASYVDLERGLEFGDRLRVGSSEATITAVGAIAGENLRSLGHIVVYCNPEAGQALLPGAVHATGTLEVPPVGSTIELMPEEG